MFTCALVYPLTREELMLDDLRNSVNAAYEEELAEEEKLLEMKRYKSNRGFLGMTALQRFIVSVIFFLMVLIVGAAILVVSQKMMPPIS